jgi:putative flippase GtrA
MRLVVSRLSWRLVRFALVGVANTLLGLVVIYALKWGAQMRDLPANLFGYLAGIVLSYFLNARWTFTFRGRHSAAAPRFLITLAAAYLANLATVYAALAIPINSYLAQAAGVVPYAVISYLGAALFAFRNPAPTPAADSGEPSQNK